MRSTVRIGTHPIHPMLITIPFAFWTVGVLYDVVAAVREWHHDTSYLLILIGCLGALLAAVPGLVDWATAIPGGTDAKRIGLRHGILNVVALVLFYASLKLRAAHGVMTYPAYGAEGVAFLCLLLSGWLGGSLVYDHRVGVPEAGER